MKHKNSKVLLLILAILCVVKATTGQTAAFTYQGRFTDSAVPSPTNGFYNMQFAIYDAISGGNLVAAAITNPNVQVSNGVFTVSLDYGATVFPGAERFLEIRVLSSAGGYVPLNPRQPISSAPYAIRSSKASSADNSMQLGGIDANQFLTGQVVRSVNNLNGPVRIDAGANVSITPNGNTLTIAASGGGAGTITGVSSGNGLTGGGTTGNVNLGIANAGVGTLQLADGGVTDAKINTVSGAKVTGPVTNAINASQLGGVTANQFVQTSDPRMTDARNPIAGSPNYIQNTSAQTVANFNISGTGMAAGTLSGGVVNANTQFNLSGNRVLSNAGSFNLIAGVAAGNVNVGTDNAFVGAFAGSNNSLGSSNSFLGSASGLSNTFGSNNSFVGADAGGNSQAGNGNSYFGYRAGYGSVSGYSNTIIGSDANVLSPNLFNVTVLGGNAAVSQSNSLVLGSINGVNGATADTRVGIGTTAPSERLTVATPTSNYGFVHTDGTITVGSFVGGSGNGGYFGTKSNHPLHFFVNNGGPAVTLDTTGVLRVNNLGAAGSTQLCRNASNQISTCSSSLRYKTNIAPFAGGMAVLDRLRPISFDWKDGGMKDVGFGAEDVAAVDPRLASYNEKGEVEGVKYDRLSVVFVNAIKEQDLVIKNALKQIESLQKELWEQKKLVRSLQRMVCSSRKRTAACRGGIK